MHRPLLPDRELVTWQLFYLFAQHARAINNFATLLLRYSAYYTYPPRVAKAPGNEWLGQRASGETSRSPLNTNNLLLLLFQPRNHRSLAG